MKKLVALFMALLMALSLANIARLHREFLAAKFQD